MTADPLNADPIELLTWRPMGRSDAKAWAALLNAIEDEDKAGESYDEDDATEELGDPLLDFEAGTLAAFDGETMVGYSLTAHRPLAEEEHLVYVSGGVDPAYRRRGIGTRLLRSGVASAQRLHARHHSSLKLAVQVQVGDHVTGAGALYRAEGLVPVRWYFHMEHPLGDAVPAASAPAGMRIESHTAENAADFHDIRNESFLDHWGSTPMTGEEWEQRVLGDTLKPELSFLLADEASGVAAGMLITKYWEACTQATGVRDAHFMIIGTRRAYRKRGVASGLIAHALRAAAEQGYGRASLDVDADNPTGALGLYEKAGFVAKERYTRYSISM